MDGSAPPFPAGRTRLHSIPSLSLAFFVKKVPLSIPNILSNNHPYIKKFSFTIRYMSTRNQPISPFPLHASQGDSMQACSPNVVSCAPD